MVMRCLIFYLNLIVYQWLAILPLNALKTFDRFDSIISLAS